MFSVLLCILWLLLVPFCCGVLLTKYLPAERHGVGYIFLNGYLVMMALFHCFYLGFLFAGSISFEWMTVVFAVFILLFAVCSAWFGREILKEAFGRLKGKEALVLKLVFGAMVLFQLAMRLAQQISDGDDAFYIATASASYTSGTMNYIQPYTGIATSDLDLRHAFSSAPIWLAFMSKVSMVHPAIMGHSVLSLVLIVLHYLVILGVGDVLFSDKKNEKYLFACLVALFNVYGYVSIYTPQTFFLTRTWQGKSIFANLFLPVLLLLLLWIGEVKQKEKISAVYYIVAAIVMFASTAMTTLSAVMMPMIFMIGICFLAIYHKNGWLVFKGAAACVPAGMVALLYVIA